LVVDKRKKERQMTKNKKKKSPITERDCIEFLEQFSEASICILKAHRFFLVHGKLLTRTAMKKHFNLSKEISNELQNLRNKRMEEV
jgi:hypothetical protein